MPSRGLLIDSSARSVYETELMNMHLFGDICRSLSSPIKYCHTFNSILMSKAGDRLFVDDDALSVAGNPVFAFVNKPEQCFAGNGLILRPSSRITLDWLKSVVIFPNFETTGKFQSNAVAVYENGEPVIPGGVPTLRPRKE